MAEGIQAARLWKRDGQNKVIGMTTLDNLRTRRRQLEDHLKQILGAEEREKVEGELMKIDIALSFLEKEAPSQPTVSK